MTIGALMLTALVQGAALGAALHEEAVELKTATGVIQGTLLLPAGGQGKVPVALLIAGSGPTDRNGNTPMLPGANNSLKLLAEALAEQGVGSLRYDKRGIGGSAGAARSEAELRFTHYVDDAAGWIAQMRQDSRFSTIAVIGHSEGSLIGMMAAHKAHADAFVSLAGAGRPAADALTEQLDHALPPQARPEAMRILNELRAGRSVAEVPASLNVLFRPSVQPYLLSWLPIDPAAELAKLRVPVLIVQGTTDIQIGVKDAELLGRSDANRQPVIIDGMNHVLKEVREPSAQMASYSDPNLPLHKDLARQVGAFVLAQPAR